MAQTSYRGLMDGETSAQSGKPWSGGGREELAAAVRRLMTLTVAASAAPAVLEDVSRRASELADELERHVVDAGTTPFARFSDRSVSSDDVNTLAGAMPFDMIIGSCNPVAPPIAIEFEPPKAIGTVTFGAQYEGAPGCVHGAALAGAFDIMLTAANIVGGAAGPDGRTHDSVSQAHPYCPAGRVRSVGHTEEGTTHPQSRAADPKWCGHRRGHWGSSSTWSALVSRRCTAETTNPGAVTRNRYLASHDCAQDISSEWVCLGSAVIGYVFRPAPLTPVAEVMPGRRVRIPPRGRLAHGRGSTDRLVARLGRR